MRIIEVVLSLISVPFSLKGEAHPVQVRFSSYLVFIKNQNENGQDFDLIVRFCLEH